MVRSGVSATQLTVAFWRKSRHSNSDGACVEAAALSDGRVAVRDSRHPEGPAMIYTRTELATFVRAAKKGDHDRPTG